MSVDSEGPLICDIRRLGNHLIQQHNYRPQDVTELTEFLTKQSYRTPTNFQLTPYMYKEDIRLLLNNHTVNDVTLQGAAEFYINTGKLVKHHHHMLRIILQCLT